MNDILCIVPAREGSKGVIGKNRRIIGGKPLVSWSLEVALQASHLFSDIILSTDDAEIADIGRKVGVSVPFTRPSDLASDTSKTIDVVKHVVSYCKEQGAKFDAVMLLQPTTPLRALEDIETAVKLFRKSDADSVISVVRTLSHHPTLMKKVDGEGYLTHFYEPEIEGTRRQDYRPEAFLRNGCIYLTRRTVIEQTNSLWGKKILPYVMPEERSVNIDSEMDFWICEYLINEMAG